MRAKRRVQWKSAVERATDSLRQFGAAYAKLSGMYTQGHITAWAWNFDKRSRTVIDGSTVTVYLDSARRFDWPVRRAQEVQDSLSGSLQQHLPAVVAGRVRVWCHAQELADLREIGRRIENLRRTAQ